MTAKRRTNYGGNRAGHSARPAFVDDRHKVAQTGPLIEAKGVKRDSPLAHCSVCGLDVPVREDGTLRPHRVGSVRTGRWPCPGGVPRFSDDDRRSELGKARARRDGEMLAAIIRETPGVPQLYKSYTSPRAAITAASQLNCGRVLGFESLEFTAAARGNQMWITYQPKED